MAYALPYDEVLNNVLYGRGERAGSIVMPTAPEYTPAWLRYSTNIAKAAQLMKEAGNPKINVPLYYLRQSTDQTSIAILVKAAWRRSGSRRRSRPRRRPGCSMSWRPLLTGERREDRPAWGRPLQLVRMDG